MKKMVLSFIMITGLSLSTNTFAGGVKNIMMDAEDAIYSEFYKNGRQVESITNYSFTSVKSGIGVKADVETINPQNRYPQSWTCVVTFQKEGNSYLPVDVDCK